MQKLSRGAAPVAQLQFKMMCERPSLASLVSPPHEGEITACNVRALFSPSVRGRAAEGGRGSLARHLELELNTRLQLLHQFLSFIDRPTVCSE
jgi:hypothetical protein